MVNCPRCGTPNPDQTADCLACKASLGGQRFAQALDAARPPPPPPPPSALRPPAQPADLTPLTAAPAQIVGLPPLTALGAASGQAEVQSFLEQARRRSRRRRLTAAAVSVLLVTAGAVYLGFSARSERQRQAAALFLKDFGDVESGPLASFWRCTVRARQSDVHRASDNLVVMEALTRAFNADPEHQPTDLERKCLPLLALAEARLGALAPPTAFVQPVDALELHLGAVRRAFVRYIERLTAVREQTAREQALLAAARVFHGGARTDPSATAAGYVHALRCAIPALPKMAQQVRQPPDTQALVEHIYNTCKDEPRFAARLRDDCASALADAQPDRLVTLVQRRMSGDDRDVSALEDCFRRAGREAFGEALDAVGKSWVDYRNAIKGVFSRIVEFGGKAAAGS